MLPIRVTDLKQYAYCQRIVFYQYVMPVEKKTTFKMEQGKLAQQAIEELEKRRKLSRYGLDRGSRKFNVRIESKTLGLAGKLDLLIETEEALYPVDFKMTFGEAHRNHAFQLCGYALMLEEVYKKPSPRGFVYLIPKKDAEEVVFTPELRNETRQALAEIRIMITDERLPEPTPLRNRCTECEFKNYCNDIF